MVCGPIPLNTSVTVNTFYFMGLYNTNEEEATGGIIKSIKKGIPQELQRNIVSEG